MVCVGHFTTSNHPDIGRWHSPRGAESIKLAYGMIQKKFQKICMKAIFLIWPQRGKQNRISITGHGFSENWLPDLHLDEMRLRRDNIIVIFW